MTTDAPWGSPPETIIDRLTRLPREWWLIIGMLIVIPIGVLDIASGPYIPLSVLNIVPVVVIGWYGGRGAGMVAALQAGALAFIDAYASLPYELGTGAVAWNLSAASLSFVVMAELGARLGASYKRQAAMATLDHLTGLPNMRGFRARGEVELARARRAGATISAAFLDCDNFKMVNDQRGHAEGDEVLRVVGVVLAKNLRPADVPGRLGGDEFAIVMPECAADQAMACMTRIRDALNGAMTEHAWPVSFSVGVATFETVPASVDELLTRVDALQYLAKRSGKNRIRWDRDPAAKAA